MATGKTVNNSGIQDIDALLWGSKWSTGNLTFSFPTSANRYDYDGEPDEGFTVLTDELKDAVRDALSIFSTFANLTFTEITETSSTHADLRFAMADISAKGRGYFPGDAAAKSGDVWLSTDDSWSGLDRGDGDFMTIMHEIGHALGLSHPNGLEADHDGWEYSVMNYRAYPGEPDGTDVHGTTGEFPQTPMLADVAALQYMYGANFSHNNSDTVYRWSSTTGEMFIDGEGQGAPASNTIFMTLWDGGGVDTYDFSNYATDAVIDLRPGAWSAPSENQVAWLDWPDVSARGSIANALLYQGDTRSLIENANGGSGDDALTGNQRNNVLMGNGGDDTFFYTGGFDTFHGGAKDTAGDTANYSLADAGVVITPAASFVTTSGPAGHEITLFIDDTSPAADASGNTYDAWGFTGVAGFPLVDIGRMTGIENITGSGFGDIIKGNRGDNVILGGGGADHIYYIGGDDTLGGGSGTDTVDFSDFAYGVSLTLQYYATAAEVWTQSSTAFTLGVVAEAIVQLSGFENAVGTDHGDRLAGNSGDNRLDGGAGNDVLLYGSGFDTLIGGAGSDTADFNALTMAVSVDLAGTGYEVRTNGTGNVTTGKALAAAADLQEIENLTGSGYSDVLRGGAGTNVLNGLAGNDVLTGRGGADRFVFSDNFGDDTITDFQAGLDRIDLSALAGVNQFKDLDFSQVGNATLIEYGADSILLTGVSLVQLGVNDFIL